MSLLSYSRAWPRMLVVNWNENGRNEWWVRASEDNDDTLSHASFKAAVPSFLLSSLFHPFLVLTDLRSLFPS